MKKFLFTLLCASGLLALVPTDSKAVTVVVGESGVGNNHYRHHHAYHRDYYHHAYHHDYDHGN